jgi:hypothetical protein
MMARSATRSVAIGMRVTPETAAIIDRIRSIPGPAFGMSRTQACQALLEHALPRIKGSNSVEERLAALEARLDALEPAQAQPRHYPIPDKAYVDRAAQRLAQAAPVEYDEDGLPIRDISRD